MAATIKDIKKLAKRDSKTKRGGHFDGEAQYFVGPEARAGRGLRRSPFKAEAAMLAARLKE